MRTLLVISANRDLATSLSVPLQTEQVTVLTAVPTVWLGMLDALEKHPGRWKLAPGLRGLAGGTAPPESMLRRFDRLPFRRSDHANQIAFDDHLRIRKTSLVQRTNRRKLRA